MDGDLSLSQSLGGLRIANPDNLSPSSLTEESNDLTPSVSPLSISDQTVSNGTRPMVLHTTPTIPGEDLNRAPSPLGFNPSSFSTEENTMEKPPALGQTTPLVAGPASSPKQSQSYQQRNNKRQSIPLTYQDQQQAQFPQYPTMIPQNQRSPSSASRPVSNIYTRSPSGDAIRAEPPRQGSYRIRSESSQSTSSQSSQSSRVSASGMPHRSNSRSAVTAMQAGVPIREGDYTDRTYRHNQNVHNGNAPFPARKTSRGMMRGPSTSNVSLASACQGLGSPYGLDSGPLASSEEWQERGASVGIRRDIDADGKPITRYVKKGVKDFQFGRTLGEGSYSTVVAATDRQTLKEYAIKVLDKRHIIKEKKVKYVNIEKDTLNRLTEHPGVVRLYYTFQDERSLYFVLDLASGGELLGVLKRMKTFDEECTRFYGAQILDTIEYMHSNEVIHRDLKPENVLLDGGMHVKITDFGTAKIIHDSHKGPDGRPQAGQGEDGSEDNRANSFVGTAEYVSPELLKDKNACKASDLWAFGCIIYQLLAGRPPFKAGNEYQTFQKIVALDYEFPNGFPEVARDLVQKLLVLDPSDRLSIGGIKHHPFFQGITWGSGLWAQKAPRLKSHVPAAAEPIKLNGNGSSNGMPSTYPSIQPSHTTKAIHIAGGSANNGTVRPSPRVITKLPPPTQLDIEWSPVLTRVNERIVKLGNLMVLSAPAPHSPQGKNGAQSGNGETSSRLSRFFGGNNTKKHQRLVIVTSSARLVIVAAGGEDKKTKIEVSLLGPGCTCKRMQDSKGLNFWCVDTVSFPYSTAGITRSSFYVSMTSILPSKISNVRPLTGLPHPHRLRNGSMPLTAPASSPFPKAFRTRIHVMMLSETCPELCR